MAPEQDWCLECGHAVSTRVAPPPSWAIPVAVALGTLALLALAVVLTVNALSNDADKAVSSGSPRAAAPTRTAPARPTQTRRRTTTPAAAPARTTSTQTPPAQAPTQTVPGATQARGAGPVPIWESRRRAYTLVALTTSDRPTAERRARELISQGLNAGVLRTNGYDFFDDGYWVTWVGQYVTRPGAERAATAVKDRVPTGYVTLVRRQGGP
jgi:hypothetical protein